MPSSIGHAAVAVLLRPMLPPSERNVAVISAAAIGAVALDIDAIGRLFGRGDIAALGGHRALTHSILFGLVLTAAISVALVNRKRATSFGAVFFYVAVVVGSHGALDMFTKYGDGVEFLAPFSTSRWTSPWQPFGGWLSEMVALWLPAALVLILGRNGRHLASSSSGILFRLLRRGPT